MRTEMVESARKHGKIASNIRELVVYPFGRWCDQHSQRVQNSQDDLQNRIKAHDKQAEYVRKLRSAYFNKCRLVEDLEEEDKLAFKEPTVEPASSSPKQQTPTVKVHEPEDEEEPEPLEIGDQHYGPEEVKKILTQMLDQIKMKETKVPILGTYQNTSSGADIVDYIQKSMGLSNVAYAEKIGEDLIKHGFLRLVGSVGNTFANSSRMNYQWRPKAFKVTGLPERKKTGGLERSNTVLSMDSFDSPLYESARDYLNNWNPLNNPYPNETPSQKLRREAREADERYKAAVRKLDLLRCTLEEAMIEHLKFMERCELDRLKAIKSVVLDFSGAISNVIPSLQSTIDKMMLFQETVQPLGDLRYMLENYRTGPFVPKVPVYENYYNSVDDQAFGIDVEARARADKKRVPLIVTSILTFLDQHYPLLENDEVRRLIWVHDVPLAATHRLRNDINTGRAPTPEVLEKYEVPIVAAVLKLYLLELPDSLVPSSLYEVIKAIYTNPTTAGSSADSPEIQDALAQTRATVLIGTLGQLRLANIATLDAIITHFARLLDLTSAPEDYTSGLIRMLAPCILRPRSESSVVFEERYNQRFLRDLLEHKDAIFAELKRNAAQNAAAGLSHSASVARAMTTAARPRAISSDESSRRAAMEERNRAIAANNRSRAASPSRDASKRDSGERSYHDRRRDSSRGPPEVTRFPVHVSGMASPRSASGRHAPSASLGVPNSAESSPVSSRDRASTLSHGENVDGTLSGGHAPVMSPTSPLAASAASGDSKPNGHHAPARIASPSYDSAHARAIADAQRAAQSAEDSADELIRETERFERRSSSRRNRPISVVKRNSQRTTSLSAPEAAAVVAASESDALSGKRGVELVDRPMDD